MNNCSVSGVVPVVQESMVEQSGTGGKGVDPMSTPGWARHPRPASPRWLAGGALLVVVLVAAACSSGGTTAGTTSTVAGGSATSSPGSAVVKVASVGSLGGVLVDASGQTLYRYTLDTGGTSACTGTCASLWTPLTVPAGTAHVLAGTGVSSADLGTISRSDGSHQVTFKGMPLYTYTGDTKTGVASGQGVDGTWFVVSGTAPSAATGTSSTSTTAPSSGGYGY